MREKSSLDISDILETSEEALTRFVTLCTGISRYDAFSLF
jgi:hypothetical protein